MAVISTSLSHKSYWSGSIWIFWVLLPVFAVKGQSIRTLQAEANRHYGQNLPKAIRLFEQARQLARVQGRPDQVANILVDEATAYYVHENYLQATTICRAGISLPSLADSTQFKLWASLGEMYHQQNRPDSASSCWQRADVILEGRPVLENEARTYVAAYWGNRGTAYFEQNDYRMAERCFQKRLLLLARHSTAYQQAIAENQFAYFYLKTAQHARADSLFSASIRHYTAPEPMRGWLLLGLADCRLQTKKPRIVLRLLREVRQIARKIGPDGAEMVGYADQSMGQYWQLQRNPLKARLFFQRALNTGETLGNTSRLAGRSLLALSRLAHQKGNTALALSQVQRVLQLNSIHFSGTELAENPAPTDFLNGPDLFESMCWKAHLLSLSQKKLPNALRLADQTYGQAFALSDVLQGAYSSELTKLFMRDKLRPAYRDAVAIAYDRYRQQPGPATLAGLIYRQEQGNAWVLHETQRTLQNLYPNAPPRLLEQLHRAKTQLSEAKSNWINTRKLDSEKAGEKALLNAEMTWNRSYQALQPYRVGNSQNTNLIATLQQRLPPKTAFLQYSLTPDSLLLTVVTAQKVRVLLLPVSREELTQLATRFQYEVSRNPDPFSYAGQAPAQTLFRKLLQPVWSDLQDTQRLMIVRDGPLHYLPMEVLETGFRTNDYLLRRMAITYTYSMYSLIGSSVERLAGNPAILAMAPFSVDNTTLPTVLQQGYKPLEGSEREAMGRVSTYSTATNANKRNFLNLLPAHQVLHLATHASASETSPDESYIAFFPGEASHRLYAHELGLLNLRHVRLSILTGCNTGRGVLTEGDGLLSLSRAFTAAGCPEVITSLWETHDGTTALLMQLFYEELQQGKPTDVALQQAKLRFLDKQTTEGKFSPPHFWAHLILIGDNTPVYPVPSTWPWLLLGVTSVSILALGTYRFRYHLNGR